MIKKGLLILFMFFSLGITVENAKISVVTDLDTARIHIDGVFVGVNSVQAYQVEPGEHYVMVEYRGKKIFARTYKLKDGEVKVIPTAHFVDFKTNVASRGAVDVEAARIRETRGDFAIGAQASSSIGGLSLKKWLGERFGLQVFGFINNGGKGTNYQSGGRLLFWLADKVVFDAPFSGYVFAGAGGDNLNNPGEAKYNIKRSVSNFGFGIETAPFGVNGLYLSLELGAERKFVTYTESDKSSEVVEGMVYGGGLHLYF